MLKVFWKKVLVSDCVHENYPIAKIMTFVTCFAHLAISNITLPLKVVMKPTFLLLYNFCAYICTYFYPMSGTT